MIGIRLSIVLVIVIFFNFAKCSKCDCQLLSVITLYRHGARTPFKMYKKDPYLNLSKEIFPEGLRQLTNLGKNQQFQLGKWFRKHYKDFIPVKYDHKFIKVISSNKDRCLMSAACNLAGLFPPKDSEIWNKKLLWQPVPIRAIPEDNDVLFTMRKPCPKHEKLLIDLKTNHRDYKKFMETTQPTIKYIEKHSGQKFDFGELVYFHDVLFIEQSYGLVLPKWTDNIFPNLTLPFVTFNFIMETYTSEMARLRSGPLIDYITTFFENVVTEPQNSQKFLMLSGHDNTIVCLLNSLEIYDGSWPEYATAVNFELISKKNQLYINIFLKNSTANHKLNLKNCDFDCNFGRFKQITEHLRIKPEKWDKECFDV